MCTDEKRTVNNAKPLCKCIYCICCVEVQMFLELLLWVILLCVILLSVFFFLGCWKAFVSKSLLWVFTSLFEGEGGEKGMADR